MAFQMMTSLSGSTAMTHETSHRQRSQKHFPQQRPCRLKGRKHPLRKMRALNRPVMVRGDVLEKKPMPQQPLPLLLQQLQKAVQLLRQRLKRRRQRRALMVAIGMGVAAHPGAIGEVIPIMVAKEKAGQDGGGALETMRPIRI